MRNLTTEDGDTKVVDIVKKPTALLMGLLLIALVLNGCIIRIGIGITLGSVTAWVFESTEHPEKIMVMSYPDTPTGYLPLGNARVEVRDQYTNELEASTYTDSEGCFSFSDIPGGKKKIVIYHPRYSSITYEIPIHILKGINMTTSEPVVHYVFIGIDEYPYIRVQDPEVQDPERANLDVSAKDVYMMRRAFVKGNRMVGSCQELINDQATKARIYNAIRNAARIAKPNDALVLYFSGYADYEIYAGGVAPPLDHLVPYDGTNYGTPEQIMNSVITDGELERWLSLFPNKNVTVILDVAYAATFIDGVAREQSLGEIELLALKNKGYTVLAATASDERNIVNKDKYSLFTYWLVSGIEKLPYKWITAGDLFSYASSKMEEGGFPQTPKLEGSGNTLLHVKNSYYW